MSDPGGPVVAELLEWAQAADTAGAFEAVTVLALAVFARAGVRTVVAAAASAGVTTPRA